MAKDSSEEAHFQEDSDILAEQLKEDEDKEIVVLLAVFLDLYEEKSKGIPGNTISALHTPLSCHRDLRA